MNDPPEIVGPTDVDFPENSAYAVAEYTVEGVDAGETAHWKPLSGTGASEFSLTSTGDDPAELRFNSPPDYESFDTGNDEHIFLLTIMVEVGGEMKTEHVRVDGHQRERTSFVRDGDSTTRNVGENAGPNEDHRLPGGGHRPGRGWVETTPDRDDDAASFDIDLYFGTASCGLIRRRLRRPKSSYTVTVSVDRP